MRVAVFGLGAIALGSVVSSAPTNGLLGPVPLTGQEKMVVDGFRRGDLGETRGIRLYDANGNNPVPLTDFQFRDSFPSWTPDGQRIVFTRHLGRKDSSKEIMIMQKNATGLVRLTNDDFNDEQPHVSPDGTQVAFHRTWSAGKGKAALQRDDIFVMSLDGTNQFNVTARLSPTAKYSDPRWSPDGRIVFIAREDNGLNDNVAAIYLIAPDGSGQEQLTAPTDRVDSDPSIDLTGNLLAFARIPRNFLQQILTRNFSDDWEIVKKDRSTGEEVVLAVGKAYCCPTWRPDGSAVVFPGNLIQPEGETREIIEVRFDGSAPSPITGSFDFIETYVELTP